MFGGESVVNGKHGHTGMLGQEAAHRVGAGQRAKDEPASVEVDQQAVSVVLLSAIQPRREFPGERGDAHVANLAHGQLRASEQGRLFIDLATCLVDVEV